MENMDFDIFKIEKNNLKPQKGRILISEPFLNDGIFSRSVVFLVQHNDEEGSMGFVLNKLMPPSHYPKELTQELDNKINIAYGGPVETDKMFYIHTLPPSKLPYSQEIMPGIYWGGDYEVLKRKIKNKEINLQKIRFFVGYSGWSPFQLKGELDRNAWIVGTITPAQIFSPDENLWSKVLDNFNLKYKLWKTYPITPEYN